MHITHYILFLHPVSYPPIPQPRQLFLSSSVTYYLPCVALFPSYMSYINIQIRHITISQHPLLLTQASHLPYNSLSRISFMFFTPPSTYRGSTRTNITSHHASSHFPSLQASPHPHVGSSFTYSPCLFRQPQKMNLYVHHHITSFISISLRASPIHSPRAVTPPKVPRFLTMFLKSRQSTVPHSKPRFPIPHVSSPSIPHAS